MIQRFLLDCAVLLAARFLLLQYAHKTPFLMTQLIAMNKYLNVQVYQGHFWKPVFREKLRIHCIISDYPSVCD